MDADPEGVSVSVPLFTLQGEAPRPPIVVDLKLGTTTVQFELDTGAAVTVMAESTFRRLFPTLKLRRSKDIHWGADEDIGRSDSTSCLPRPRG